MIQLTVASHAHSLWVADGDVETLSRRIIRSELRTPSIQSVKAAPVCACYTAVYHVIRLTREIISVSAVVASLFPAAWRPTGTQGVTTPSLLSRDDDDVDVLVNMRQ